MFYLDSIGFVGDGFVGVVNTEPVEEMMAKIIRMPEVRIHRDLIPDAAVRLEEALADLAAAMAPGLAKEVLPVGVRFDDEDRVSLTVRYPRAGQVVALFDLVMPRVGLSGEVDDVEAVAEEVVNLVPQAERDYMAALDEA